MSMRGFSLTELLIVMGMTSVVLTGAVGMVHRLMHEQELADRENVMHLAAERLSTRLREDVHLANRAALISSGDDGAQSLVLNQAGESIVTYIVRNNVLERASTQESRPTHRDSFRFPENYHLEFFEVLAERVTFTAFVIPQASLATGSDKPRGKVSKSDVRRTVLRVEASVGRDHRFLSQPRKPGES